MLLCRETLIWLAPDSPDTATSYHQLGILARDRGDYDAAEPLYRRSLEINEQLGNQATTAATYTDLVA